MTATRLSTIRVEKPWGRKQLWPGFEDASGGPVGEIWFDAPAETHPELLVKYLFTSERLSIQVHPDDATARASGYPNGKDEAWVVLAAEPDSTIALGMKHPVTREELRAAALDGSIEALVDWRPVKAGDVIYSPAGTIHAIGAGLTIIEVQQNLDLTYRLYDYGRPRELHLDAGVAVSAPVPFTHETQPIEHSEGRKILCAGGKFVLERWTWEGTRIVNLPAEANGWLIAVAGDGALNAAALTAGDCWLLEGITRLTLNAGAEVLFAYPQTNPLPDIFG